MVMRTDSLKLKTVIKSAKPHKILRRIPKRGRNSLILKITSAVGLFTRGGDCFMIRRRLSPMLSSHRLIME